MECVSITLQGLIAVAAPELAESFHINSLFVSSAVRPALDAGSVGKNLRQRAKALAAIAHPDDRESLERAIHDRFARKG